MPLVAESIEHTSDSAIRELSWVQRAPIDKMAMDDVPGLPENFKLGRLIGCPNDSRHRKVAGRARRHPGAEHGSHKDKENKSTDSHFHVKFHRGIQIPIV